MVKMINDILIQHGQVKSGTSALLDIRLLGAAATEVPRENGGRNMARVWGMVKGSLRIPSGKHTKSY